MDVNEITPYQYFLNEFWLFVVFFIVMHFFAFFLGQGRYWAEQIDK